MAREGELNYLKNIGEEGRWHAVNKPFSDPECGHYFYDMGMIFQLLPPPPGKVLDLGVGTGWTSVFLAQRGYDVVGQDLALDMVDACEENRQRSGLDNIRFIVSDYESLDFREEFDCALFYASLHHSEDPQAALVSVCRALKPGGILVTLEPGVGHADSETSIMVMEKYGVTERDTPPRDIIRMGKSAGFREGRIYLRDPRPHPAFMYMNKAELINAAKAVGKSMPWGAGRYSNFVLLRK